MKVLTLDVETTTFQKGNCFSNGNKLVCIAWRIHSTSYCELLSPETVTRVQAAIDESELIVGFNFKFDFHWLRKAGLNLSGKRIWDVQIAEYILRYQAKSYLSLQTVCEDYGIPGKEDEVAKYWEAGIDTPDIPWDVLSSYGKQDVLATEQCYFEQQKRATSKQKRLIIYSGMDMHTLQEMEWNGLFYDEALCEQRNAELEEEKQKVLTLLNSIYPGIPINFNSPKQLSAFLFGGEIKEIRKEHNGFFKTGAKAGSPKYSNVEYIHQLPQLFKPDKRNETATKGVYSTDEETLRGLKGRAAAKYVEPLLQLAKIEKLQGTYYKGIPNINAEYRWPHRTIHGTINQTVTGTGRTSASKPNQQNFAGDCQDIFITRYE